MAKKKPESIQPDTGKSRLPRPMSDEKRLGRPPRHKAITEAPGAKDQAPRDDEADDEDQDVFSRYRDDINKYGWEEVFLGL